MSGPPDPSSPLYHPALHGVDTSKLDDLANRSRDGRAKQAGKFDVKAGAASGKGLGRLGAWVKATRAGKKKLAEGWIADDAKAHADAKKKAEEEQEDARERVEKARSAIGTITKGSKT
jgi:hypothetical protein